MFLWWRPLNIKIAVYRRILAGYTQGERAFRVVRDLSGTRTSLTMLTLSSPFFFFSHTFLHTSPFTPESGLVSFL